MWSNGRPSHELISSSRLAQMRDTSLLEMPASTPNAVTRSSTLRVDTPCTNASITTACNATSIRRQGASSDGKKLPERSFGIATSTSPDVVETSLDRVPLRCVVRAGERSYRPAPTTALASASINCCNIVASSRRINVPSSAVLSDSTSSSSADCSRAITCILSANLVVHRASRGGPPPAGNDTLTVSPTLQRRTSIYTTPRDSYHRAPYGVTPSPVPGCPGQSVRRP